MLNDRQGDFKYQLYACLEKTRVGAAHPPIPATHLWSDILCQFVGALEQRVSSVTYMERINVALWLLGMNFNGKMQFFSSTALASTTNVFSTRKDVPGTTPLRALFFVRIYTVIWNRLKAT